MSSEFVTAQKEGTLWGVFFLLFCSLAYLSILSLLNAQGIVSASPMLIGAMELMLYLGCFFFLRSSFPLGAMALIFILLGSLGFLGLLRGEFDPKGMRDLLIPILFFCLGRNFADIRIADRMLKIILVVVALFGLFEVLFLDLYSSLFNTFSFYVNTGGAQAENAMFEDQMLTLNGFRPEGGRTILPMVFEAHRASSLLMEPVSLGNFAVIVLAWGLSKARTDWQNARFFILGGCLLIALADSRFALMMLVPMLLLRALPARISATTSWFWPGLFLLLILIGPSWATGEGDNLAGRIARSGAKLLEFDLSMLFGLASPLPGFWDMGFAYVLSRLGFPLCVALVFIVNTVPIATEEGGRFRAYLLLYLSAILAVSGTSFFALKTASVLWFLFGAVTARNPEAESPLVALAKGYQLLARFGRER